MNKDEGKKLLLTRSKAFRDRYFKAYGRMALRVGSDSYLMTRNTLPLSGIRESDIHLYDINTGEIGLLFRSRSDINAVVLACTEASVLFSSDAQLMRPALDDLAQIIGPDVRISASEDSSEILRALKDRNGCFLRKKGILGIGRDLDEAVAAALILEKSAEAEVLAHKVGGLKYLSPAKAKEMRLFYLNKYTKVNTQDHVPFVNIGSEEFKIRNAIIDCGKEMCHKDLVQGSWGNISVRLNRNEMLITPSGMDYFDIKTEDIVKVNIGTLEYISQGRRPSSEVLLHADIYKSHPGCNAVIHTHSNGCSVFAAARAGFRIDNPLIHEIIGDMNVTEPEMPGTPELSREVNRALVENSACIIANHGAIFCGPKLEIVLNVADAIEAKACNLLGLSSSIRLMKEKEEEAELQGQ